LVRQLADHPRRSAFPSDDLEDRVERQHITSRFRFTEAGFFCILFLLPIQKNTFVKIILTLLTFVTITVGLSQEFESDLFLSLKTSSLHNFWKSGKKTMNVSTLRKSKDKGIVEETFTTYRKGKINPNKINFNIKYSEYFVLEDRKKSLGKYEFDENERLYRYERTDFDNRNQRTYTMYHFYYYTEDILSREDIRTKEYVGQGSVEQDTVVYRDSIIYKVSKEGEKYKQENLSDPGVYSTYEMKNGDVLYKTNYFEGFHEIVTYTIDSKGHLVKIETKLIGEDGNSISTRTDLHYSIEGLLTETKFYDEKEELLERKVYSYK
jgi:hypothetical protein